MACAEGSLSVFRINRKGCHKPFQRNDNRLLSDYIHNSEHIWLRPRIGKADDGALQLRIHRERPKYLFRARQKHVRNTRANFVSFTRLTSPFSSSSTTDLAALQEHQHGDCQKRVIHMEEQVNSESQ